MAVQAVVGDVQRAVLEPLVERGLAVVQHRAEGLLPGDQLARQATPEGLVVGVGLGDQAVVGRLAGDVGPLRGRAEGPSSTAGSGVPAGRGRDRCLGLLEQQEGTAGTPTVAAAGATGPRPPCRRSGAGRRPSPGPVAGGACRHHRPSRIPTGISRSSSARTVEAPNHRYVLGDRDVGAARPRRPPTHPGRGAGSAWARSFPPSLATASRSAAPRAPLSQLPTVSTTDCRQHRGRRQRQQHQDARRPPAPHRVPTVVGGQQWVGGPRRPPPAQPGQGHQQAEQDHDAGRERQPRQR